MPANMLRTGERVFLDDVTVEQVEAALGVPVIPVEADSGFDLVDAMLRTRRWSSQPIVCRRRPSITAITRN